MNDRERALHLSPVQVVASALASITAAVLASFFGVAGTVIGAGVVSAAASVGNAVYSYWIRSGNKALRESIPSAFKETVPSALKQPAATVRTLVGSGARVSGPSWGGINGDGADPDNTNEVPALDHPAEVPPPGRLGPPPIPSGQGPGAPPPPSGAPPPPPGVGGPKRVDLGATLEALRSSLLRLGHSLRWRNIAVATLVVFGLSMAAVTAVEALAKKPLSGIVGGSTPAGATTSLGGLVSGDQSKPSPTTPSTPSSSTTTNPQTTNPQTTNPNGSSTTTTSPSSTSTTPSTTTTPPSSTTPSTPGSTGSTPGSSGSSSGATSSGSSSAGGSATGSPSSGGASGG